ncbi:hypothetical protein V6N11_032413 [Hibiscus sabdariffa]|uniref:non-specific serine/threonine protein kinase n=1 Tax=Hibiscus sabdariffa TaxID=183260 RepID=A0ABR2T0K6_9ROSI
MVCNGMMFEADNRPLGGATYDITSTQNWAVNNVGLFADGKIQQYVHNTIEQVIGTNDPELYKTSRLSPGSLRYYGLGLENGLYTVNLFFAETGFPDPTSHSWKSKARRVFDVYIQGTRELRDFDIAKEAGGVERAIIKNFTANVIANHLEIHLFWAGKGTCCTPEEGYYGPSISAIRVVPNFIPPVGGIPPKEKNWTALIVGITVSVVVLPMILTFAITCIKRKGEDDGEDGHSDLHLDWPTRFNICLETARELAYLHEESRPRIVHRDIKASNILLDAELCPKISDFGLAKLYDDKKTHISTKVAGTMGYLAPEYAMYRHLTEKADVFGFGIVALEILSGRPNFDNSLEDDKIYLLAWAWALHENNLNLDLVDPNLVEFDENEALRVARVALLCTQGSPSMRPPMSRVVVMLAGDIEVSSVITRPSYLTDWNFRDSTGRVVTGDTQGPGAAPIPSLVNVSECSDITEGS